MKQLIFLLLTVTVISLTACSNSNGDMDIEFQTGGVTLPTAMTVDSSDGDVYFPVETDGDKEAILWESSDPSIASISNEGLLTIHKNGNVTITATSGTNSASSKLVATHDKYKDYIRINTKAEFLMTFSNPANFNDPSKKYVLTSDIDFGGAHIDPIGGWDVSNEDTPIDPATQFRATIDGRGYALMNFVIENPRSTKVDGSYFGVSLIPFIDDGVVRNLNIINATYIGTGFSGGIAGKIENGLIENCYVQASITATDGRGGLPAGGIAGIIGPHAIVQNIFLNVNISGGFIYAGFNFGTGMNSTVVSETLADQDRPNLMRETAITTSKGDDAEDAQLHPFFEVARLEHTELFNIENYMFTTSAIRDYWTITTGTVPYLIRPDGVVPNWAQI